MIESALKKYCELRDILIKKKSFLFFLLKLFIAAGLLYYIISTIKPAEIFSAFEKADLKLLLAAFLLSFINLYLQFFKWKLTCNLLLNENSNNKIAISLFHGIAAGVFTPARVGEYFGRAIIFKDKPVYKVALATLLDKFFPLLMVAFFGSITSIIFIHLEYGITYFLTFSLFLVVFILFYFLIYLIFNEKFWDSIIFSKLRKSERINYLLDELKELRKLDNSYLIKMLVISLLFYFCFLLQYALLVSAFSGKLNFLDYLWAGNLVMFAKTIIPPVSAGELGIREGASVYFISRFGEEASVGFNASIFLFIINVLLPSILGLILLLKKSDD